MQKKLINLIQTKFISAGIFFLIPVFVFIELKKFTGEIPIYGKITLFIYWFFFFIFIFPHIPQSFGGARPEPVTLIGTAEEIKYLQDFGIRTIPNGGHAVIQTQTVCKIYQNSEIVIIGVSNPVSEGISVRQGAIVLKWDKISGMHTVPPGQLALQRKFFCNPLQFVGFWR